MSKRVTQTDRVLQYMKVYGSITTWNAFTDLGITRLSAKIFDLKKLGYKIEAVRETGKNRYGDKVNYCRYSLKEEQK